MSIRSTRSKKKAYTGDGPPSQVLVGNFGNQNVQDELSAVSSLAPSRCNEHLAALFPVKPDNYRKFNPSSNLASFLNEQLELDITFVSRLAQIGLVTPSAVVNAFGQDNCTIAGSFAKMGTSHVLDQQIHKQTQVLVMFARSQILNYNMLKPKSQKKTWKQLKKRDNYDDSFNSWQENEFQRINDFIMDQSNIIIAQHEMREIRKIIQKWARNDTCSLTSSQQTNKSSRYNNLQDRFQTGVSPLAHIMKTVGDLESKMDKQVGSVLKEVKEAIQTIPSTIEKRVDQAMQTRARFDESQTQVRRKLTTV